MSSPVEPAGQRLFFALWPDAATRSAIARLADRFAKRCGGRPVPPENLHLTLAFLGRVTPARRACLEARADRAGSVPFELALNRLGYFARPRALWIGADPPPALLLLVERLREGMAACGLEPDRRPFQPHLTLRRHAFRGPGSVADPALDWRVGEFVLARSRTDPDRARYEILRRWPLSG